ncbi:MAG: D-xylose transport system substrate-binding protein [Thermoleophilaceae bacterium]|nr:D-xylose transport system substrate-binding protein [Thermoleophilaceae bacterium]
MFSALLRHRRHLAAAVSVLALAVVVGACGTSNDKKTSSSGGGGGGSASGTVGLLLPESKTTRYEAFDRPLFTKKLKQLCSSCKLLYANAAQDATQQQSQADSMLTQGVKVLVLDPVDGKAAQAIVNKAKGQNVPVVSYDRLASGPIDYYVSFDNQRVGQLQGQALLKELQKGGDPKRGPIVMINGAPTDPNAAQFKKGAHSVLDGKVTIGKEFDTPDWTPDKAQTEAQAAITALGKSKIIGFYSANDGMAGGISAAIQQAGFSKFPPLTGQDAELAGIQRIVNGQQTMTVYKAIKPEAEAAAAMAFALVKGEKYPAADKTQNNGTADVPSQLLTPVEVTKSNIKDTVVKDGFYTVKQICTKQYAAACKKAGLQ